MMDRNSIVDKINEGALNLRRVAQTLQECS